LYSTIITIVQHKHHYFTAQASLSYSIENTILQHKYHYFTAQIRLLYKTHTHTYIYILSTNIFILQHKRLSCKHKQHYCTAQTNLLYSTIITIVQHKHHYCTAQTSLFYNTRRRKYLYCIAVFGHLLFIPKNVDLLWLSSNLSVHLDTSFLVTCISKKVYESRTDEWLTAWITQRVASFGLDKYRDFHPMVFSFLLINKADKICSFSPNITLALLIYKEPWVH